VRPDWMAVEYQRGIWVPSAVMSFEHEGPAFNRLDTPGYQEVEMVRGLSLTQDNHSKGSDFSTRRAHVR
jgi:hypothetical protein